MEGIKVRRAVKDDVPGIMNLLRQVLLVHHNIRPDLFKKEGTKYNASELYDIIFDDTKPIFVACDASGKILGHCFTSIETTEHDNLVPHSTLYIDDLCIDEACRGQGIGRLLCEKALSFAREKGFYNVTIHVWSGNESDKAFYDGMGFSTYMEAMEIIL